MIVLSLLLGGQIKLISFASAEFGIWLLACSKLFLEKVIFLETVGGNAAVLWCKYPNFLILDKVHVVHWSPVMRRIEGLWKQWCRPFGLFSRSFHDHQQVYYISWKTGLVRWKKISFTVIRAHFLLHCTSFRKGTCNNMQIEKEERNK